MRVPLIISAPGFKGGLKTDVLAEYINIFPSVYEFADLELPAQLHGKSFTSLMRNPNQSFKDVIYARYINGESIKTDRYLYTEWYNNIGEIYGRMLYDHKIDPDENINISEMAENEALVDLLSKILYKEIKSANQINL